MGKDFDVAVVGGGLAGVAASVAAANLGARTLLIERSDIFGGNAGNALVHTICGLYLAAGDGPAQYAHCGFPRSFAERLLSVGAARAPEKAGRVHALPTFPHMLSDAALRVCESTDRLVPELGAELVGADAAGDSIIVRWMQSGRETETRASIAVDASGDATLADCLSAELYEESASSLQNPSYIFRVRGVDPAETEGFARMRVSHALARAEIDADLPAGAGSVLLRPGPVSDEAYVTLNVPKPPGAEYRPLEAQSLAALTVKARACADALVSYLRSHRDGFAGCEVVEWPRRLGVRETRRAAGLVTVEAEDILSGRRRDDEVALSTWPIELWNDHKGARFEYPEGPSSIALGALISRSNPRLGMAGRCLSATHEALGALRVLGTAMATGEAIGIAAALAAVRGCALSEVTAKDVLAQRR